MHILVRENAAPLAAGGTKTPHGLSGGMTGAEALAGMVETSLADIRGVLDAAATLDDEEGIHGIRIGLRRTRVPLKLFAPYLGSAAADFDDRLRRAGRVLGAARDWAVLQAEALPAARRAGIGGDRIAALIEAIQAPRAIADVAVRRELTEGFATLLPALAAWAAAGARKPASFGDADRLGRPVEALAPPLLARLFRRLAKSADGHRHADISELHKLRKRTKTMRYAAEAVAPLYGRKSVKPVVKRCKALQNLLGLVNDSAAIPDLLRLLPAPVDGELAEAIDALGRFAAERGAKARLDVTKCWHELRDTKPFWS